jgi:mannonate dehydratase
MPMTRRKLLWFGGAGVAAIAAVRFGVPLILRRGGPRPVSGRAAEFAERCFAGLDRSLVWDAHVHLVGLGAGGTGCWVNPEMQSPLHPVKQFQFDLYRAGIGMTHDATADADYAERLLELQRLANPPGKSLIFAFDLNVAEDGTERPEISAMYTPNDYVLRMAEAHPEFAACASVHPYRRDAIPRLDRAAEAGARAVKWLPNAMGIDPASPRCDAFYDRLVELDVPLIAHAGKEYAIDAGETQELGNPLLLRRALDRGVRVIVAHCGALGDYADLDAPEAGRPRVASFELFKRLLADPAYERNLFGDISALAQVNYGPRPLRELLATPEWHERLIYGSDYPLPALRFVISPTKLQLDGLLSADDRDLCNELFAANPLLFDFAVKRSLRHEVDGRTHRFSPAVFETARWFGVGS